MPVLTGTLALAFLAVASTILLAVVTLVTRRKLRRAEERSRLGEGALDTVPHAVFVVDALRSGRPNIYVNAAYSALTGYGAREAVDAGFDALSIFADSANVAELDGRSEAATGIRVRVRRRDGTTFPAKLDVSALPRNDGGRYLVGLLERVETGERATDRVPAARLGTAPTDAFLSWLTHELRSPLNACVMWLDVLALAPQPDRLAKAVDALKRNLARQTRLVSDLNDAAKPSSPASELRVERLDLVALVKRGLDAWQLLAIGKELSLRPLIELETAPVDGDPERLLQALGHLLDNAIGSTPAGGNVNVRIHATDGNCVVEIEDAGPPLSAEDAANLFTPLWRAPTSAKERPGLGLGLAVAQRIAVRHGGTLAATNGGAGARLVLTLPRALDTPA